MEIRVVLAALVRTDGGHIVHRADCYYITRSGAASRAVPWLWAAGRPVKDVSSAVAMVGARTCRICRPMFTAHLVGESA